MLFTNVYYVVWNWKASVELFLSMIISTVVFAKINLKKAMGKLQVFILS